MSKEPTQIFEPTLLKQDIDQFEIYHLNDGINEPFKVLPLGVLQIFFQLKNEVYHNTSFTNGWQQRPRAFVAGPFNKGYTMKVENGAELFSLKLRPGRYHNFFSCPIYEFKNTLVGLNEIWGRAGDVLADQIFNASSHQHRSRLVEHFLAKRYLHLDSSPIESAILALSSFEAQDQISKVASHSNLSLAQFRKRFKNEIGMSPKEFQRIKRIDALNTLLEKNPGLTFTQLAYRFHYYDQSHFIHDFRAVTGQAPSEYFS